MNNIPHFDLGGNGDPLHFLHANGYPPECYAPLLEHLKPISHVFGMKLRPLWEGANKKDLQDWHPYSEDLLRFLSDRGTDPVIGVGHSIGGIVTLRAAMRDPQKFRAVILLDPVFFVPPMLVAWNISRALGLGEKTHPLIAAAKKRRREFKDLETVYRSYRTKPVFRYMSEESLKGYIAGITKPKSDGSGFELVYTPEWETHIYLTGLRDFDLWNGIGSFDVPTLIIRGAETDTFLPNAERLVKKKNPKIQIHTMEKATHILPLEYPKEVAELIKNFLTTIQ
ncbi:MAG: alpha/beta hydrolase [Anaerolineales bacterium]|uniref:alpha/beta hydrolase n=1 Tax=Candidatus Villigracilis vicinus TaxID=3140679 RepID=UPI0031353E6A|nr:alpha/beta hydrolase [Anaerolineales bacterium]